MAAESVLNKADRLLGKPVPDTFDECIANLKELIQFYDNEFKPYYLSEEATAYEQTEMNKRLDSISEKFSVISAKMIQLKGGSRKKKRATRKLTRRRRF